MVKKAVGESTGKIILMGEHAVVYGQPAIALPFSAVEIIATVIEQGDCLTVSCQFYEGLVHAMPKVWESLKHAIRFSLYRIGAPSDPAVHVKIDSTIPAERGMGSSAAVAVAVARALFSFYGKSLSNQDLWDIVQSSEKIAHGNPSGIDAATTSGTQPIYFVKEQPIETVNLCMNAYLVVADTGQTGNTLEAIEQVASLLDKYPENNARIETLGDLTTQARQALETNQPQMLGDLMNQAQEQLQALGVSDASLDNLIEVARLQGALGAKLTGGGKGGCMIALVENETKAKQIAQDLARAGARQIWIQDLGE